MANVLVAVHTFSYVTFLLAKLDAHLVFTNETLWDPLCSWTELAIQVTVFHLYPLADLSDSYKCCELLILK